ncbi:nuclear transport factor 2 family protein [Acrocarpospora sp. B8E8]|uniref:nuclear transport factor 2 family protein n=1 Tax=Acrocarpospora sp. B8E8 TaxID=3153572 RepID=UPI00325E2026
MPIALDALPGTISGFLIAHRVRDTAAELAHFTPDATVVDDGRTHTGVGAIETWMNHAASEYTFTTTPIAAERTGDRHYTVTQHLEGDFPGGTVDLHYRFTLRGALIEHLVIEP